jgi:hypothetical protein
MDEQLIKDKNDELTWTEWIMISKNFISLQTISENVFQMSLRSEQVLSLIRGSVDDDDDGYVCMWY